MKRLLNQKIKEWTIIDDVGIYDKKSHCIKVKCQCSCGEIHMINKYTLLKNKTEKCRKCIGVSNIGSGNPYFKGYKELPGGLFSRMKRRAKKSKLQFSLSKKFLYDLFLKQNRKCKLTNLDISFENNSASLDRINSKLGYIEKNVMWVYKDINIMKNGYDLGYFISMCKKVSNLYKDNEIKINKNFNFGTH
jgi:hypothetical protein